MTIFSSRPTTCSIGLLDREPSKGENNQVGKTFKSSRSKFFFFILHPKISEITQAHWPDILTGFVKYFSFFLDVLQLLLWHDDQNMGHFFWQTQRPHWSGAFSGHDRDRRTTRSNCGTRTKRKKSALSKGTHLLSRLSQSAQKRPLSQLFSGRQLEYLGFVLEKGQKKSSSHDRTTWEHNFKFPFIWRFFQRLSRHLLPG